MVAAESEVIAGQQDGDAVGQRSGRHGGLDIVRNGSPIGRRGIDRGFHRGIDRSGLRGAGGEVVGRDPAVEIGHRPGVRGDEAIGRDHGDEKHGQNPAVQLRRSASAARLQKRMKYRGDTPDAHGGGQQRDGHCIVGTDHRQREPQEAVAQLEECPHEDADHRKSEEKGGVSPALIRLPEPGPEER